MEEASDCYFKRVWEAEVPQVGQGRSAAPGPGRQPHSRSLEVQFYFPICLPQSQCLLSGVMYGEQQVLWEGKPAKEVQVLPLLADSNPSLSY